MGSVVLFVSLITSKNIECLELGKGGGGGGGNAVFAKSVFCFILRDILVFLPIFLALSAISHCDQSIIAGFGKGYPFVHLVYRACLS